MLAALDQAPRPFGDDLGHRDVVLGGEIGGGRDDFAADASPKVGDLFGALVDQENDHVHVGIVDRDRVRHALQEGRLARLRRRHDQAALPSPDRRQQIHHTSAHLVRRRLQL